MKHIFRMEKEMEKLVKRIERNKVFLEKETANPELTDETQRASLDAQIIAMETYRDVLETRIDYHRAKACSTPGADVVAKPKRTELDLERDKGYGDEMSLDQFIDGYEGRCFLDDDGNGTAFKVSTGERVDKCIFELADELMEDQEARASFGTDDYVVIWYNK